MVFPNNYLIIKNKNHNGKIEFRALDALKHVKNEKIDISIKPAEKWKDINKDLKSPFHYDWTFSSDYEGTYTDNLKVIQLKNRQLIKFF